MFGGRLMAGQWTLTPLIGVRIPAPEPSFAKAMKEIYKIRQANITDLNILFDLLHQLSPIKEGGDLVDYKDLRGTLQRIIADDNYCLCVCEYNKEAIGTALLLIQLNLSHHGRPYGHIENVVTDKAQRGNGVGARMVKYLIQRARKRNCYKIILDCAKHNISFYKECGFIETGEVEMRI